MGIRYSSFTISCNGDATLYTDYGINFDVNAAADFDSIMYVAVFYLDLKMFKKLILINYEIEVFDPSRSENAR